MMRVRWSKTALVELDAIFRYILERSRTAASSVMTGVEELSERLGQFPMMGRPANETGVRAFHVVRYLYVIFYAIDNSTDEVVILHVRHTAQAPTTDD
jgi:plasmid stabilization system protein ParE